MLNSNISIYWIRGEQSMENDKMASKALGLVDSRRWDGPKGNGGCDGQTWNQRRETYRNKFKPCPVEKETANGL